MKQQLSVLIISAILVLPMVLAHAQDKDDDDDDHPAFHPRVLRPGEKPADADFSCPYAKGYQRPERLDGFSIRLRPGTKNPADRCRAVIVTPAGAAVPVAKDWSLKIEKISGEDVNGDGKPDLVVAGYSGGEHCCFTYTIVSLQKVPRTIHKISSRSALTFEKRTDGRVLIRGAESSLDYFLVPHPMAVVPQIYLKLQGDDLIDVSEQFRPEYDKLIDQARSELTEGDIAKFRASRYNDKMFTDQLPTVRRVLTIILNYLYSGREEQGWQALNDLWPISDQARVKNLIQQRRGRGLWAQLNAPNAAHQAER